MAHTYTHTSTQTILQEAHNEALKQLEKQMRDKADQQLIAVVTKLEKEHVLQREALMETNKQELNVWAEKTTTKLK